MLANQVPSADMLHSVGALMDTSFLRAAVADANETARTRPSPSDSKPPRFLRWVHAALTRWGKRHP